MSGERTETAEGSEVVESSKDSASSKRCPIAGFSDPPQPCTFALGHEGACSFTLAASAWLEQRRPTAQDPEYWEGGWIRKDVLAICPECGDVKEGTAGWHLAHERKCEWKPAGTWFTKRLASELEERAKCTEYTVEGDRNRNPSSWRAVGPWRADFQRAQADAGAGRERDPNQERDEVYEECASYADRIAAHYEAGETGPSLTATAVRAVAQRIRNQKSTSVKCEDRAARLAIALIFAQWVADAAYRQMTCGNGIHSFGHGEACHYCGARDEEPAPSSGDPKGEP